MKVVAKGLRAYRLQDSNKKRSSLCLPISGLPANSVTPTASFRAKKWPNQGFRSSKATKMCLEGDICPWSRVARQKQAALLNLNFR